MADETNRGPINIPVESAEENGLVTSQANVPEEDVIEIDADSVVYDEDPFVFQGENDEQVPDGVAEDEPSEAAEEDSTVVDVDDDSVAVEGGDDAPEISLNSFDPYIEPVVPAPPTATPPVAAAAGAEANAQADAGKAPEISRDAVFELMTELRQSSEAVSRLTDEKNDLLDRLLRKQAEFENFRKRGEREMQEAYVRARSDLLMDLLPVLDNFDLAMHHAENATADVIHEGMVLIQKQMLDTLLRLGLEPIDAEGQAFDPELHDAVATEVSDEVPDHTVVNVLQRGYRLGDRLLRPARVKVAVQS